MGGRRAARTDSNQTSVATKLRAHGIAWRSTAMVGDGFPDGVAAFDGDCVLVELKDPQQAPSDRKLTPKEAQFMAEWPGPRMVAHAACSIIDRLMGTFCACSSCQDDRSLLERRKVEL